MCTTKSHLCEREQYRDVESNQARGLCSNESQSDIRTVSKDLYKKLYTGIKMSALITLLPSNGACFDKSQLLAAGKLAQEADCRAECFDLRL